MATLSSDRGTGGHAANKAVPYLLNEVVDYSTQGAGATDVIEVLQIPAGSVVIAVGADVLTADTAGNSGTIAFGDGSVVYLAAATVAATGSMTGADALAELCVSYDSANTLDATGATGTINAKIRYWALVVDITEPNVTQRATFA